ncbi:MAG TPA: hypothetical protein VL051_09550 [Burkholderiaceae bacterium]|nr:hypothetical protein [Burkholderiaceae bacterium]
MSAASNYTETNVINALLRGVPFPLATAIYIGLHTADPTDAGGGEVDLADWPGYVRKDAAVGGAIASGWSDPVDGLTRNAKQIIYPSNNGADNVTITHWAAYDAATGGNMLTHAALDTPRTLEPGDVFVFDVNTLTVSQA